MARIDEMQAKIRQIEALCAELRAGLHRMTGEPGAKPGGGPTQRTDPPSEAECREEYEELYELFLAGRLAAIEEFVAGKTKEYLKVFCKHNYVSADATKASKRRIAEAIKQRLAERKAITRGPAAD
jgi:hypothetical protein